MLTVEWNNKYCFVEWDCYFVCSKESLEHRCCSNCYWRFQYRRCSMNCFVVDVTGVAAVESSVSSRSVVVFDDYSVVIEIVEGSYRPSTETLVLIFMTRQRKSPCLYFRNLLVIINTSCFWNLFNGS
jgi:hypothetical protein